MLQGCRPPASPTALTPNGAVGTPPPTPQHCPPAEDWTANMQRVHDTLDALDTPAETETNAFEEDPPTAQPASSLEEWMRGGQGSLDDLLGVLNGGMQHWGGTAHDPSALTKVVMARRSDVALPQPLDPLDLLSTLQQSRDPRCYQFALLPAPGTVFFGSSPEQLFARNGDAVASEAVAATRPRGPPGDVQGDFWLALDLLRCGKDHREFVVVRDWVREALEGVCDHVVVEREKSVLKHGAVQHLYGKLAGRLREGCDDAAILEALHPTPAVCGRARSLALQVLGQHEDFDRGMYAGPIGWIAGDAAEFAVAIRSALHTTTTDEAGAEGPFQGAHQARLSLFAGVGIVRGSDAAQEWAELDLKVLQYLRLLAPQPALDAAPNINALWARLLVDEACRLGANTFAIAPGSRSSPLTAAIAAHSAAHVVCGIDERSLAFWALGYAKATGRPAVVVCSSGTAVANLMPAVVEASQSNTPLLLLTADRPFELVDTGSNQTIDQVKIFGSYVRWHADLDAPGGEVPARVALTTMDAAVRAATGGAGSGSGRAGPVHINCRFRDPLVPQAHDWDRHVLKGLERWATSREPFTATHGLSMLPTSAEASSWALNPALLHQLTSPATRGLLVVGQLTNPADVAAAAAVADALGWPVVADALSGLRVGVTAGFQPLDYGLVMNHFDHVLLMDEASWPVLVPDLCIMLGDHLTSKRIGRFIEYCALASHGRPATHIIAVGHTTQRNDPSHVLAAHLQTSLPSLAAALQDASHAAGVAGEGRLYCDLLGMLDRAAGAEIDRRLDGQELSEPLVALHLSHHLPLGDALFLGNSMPIRDMDMYAQRSPTPHATHPTETPSTVAESDTRNATAAIDDTQSTQSMVPDGPGSLLHRVTAAPAKPVWRSQAAVTCGVGAVVGCNRGASGIDGVLSTAAGFAAGLGRATTLVVGDLSFLHDTNGLALLRDTEAKAPLTVVLINNGGGGIFSFLPIADAVPADTFTQLWGTPQHVDIAGLCRAHGIPHTRVTAADALPTALSNAWALNGHSVVEVVTDRQHNVAQHRALQTAVRGAVDVALQQWMASNAGSAQGLYDLVPGPAAVTPGTWRIEAVDLCMYAVPVSGRLTTGDLILHRKGCLLRLTLTNGQGRCRGVGDCAPLSGLHDESLQECMIQLRTLQVQLQGAAVPSDPESDLDAWLSGVVGTAASMSVLPSVRCALQDALVLALHPPATGPVEINALMPADLDPAWAARRACELVDEGFSTIKIKVARLNSDAEDVAVLRAVRKAVGPNIRLRADANRGWSLQQACNFVRALGKAPEVALEYLEEPVPEGGDEGWSTLVLLSEVHKVPLALDESLEPALRRGATDLADLLPPGVAPKDVAALVLKPSVLGGPQAVRKIARVAQPHGIKVVISSAFECSVGLAARVATAALVNATQPPTAHGLATDSWLKKDVGDRLSTIMVAKDGAMVVDAPHAAAMQQHVADAWMEGNDQQDGIDVWMAGMDGHGGIAGHTPAVQHMRMRAAVHGVEYSFSTLRMGGSTKTNASFEKSSKPTAVLLHGFLGGAGDWLPIMHGLAYAGYECVAVDLPGHGGTRVDCGAAEGPWSVEAVADAVLAAVCGTGSRAAVIGYSLGARVAMAMAARHPERIRGLVCCSGNPGIRDVHARAVRAKADDAVAAILVQDGTARFVERWYAEHAMWAPLRRHPVYERLVAARSGGDAIALAKALRCMSPGRQAPLWDALKEGPPQLVVVGSEDEAYCRIADEMAENNTKASVVRLDGCGHAVHVENAVGVVAAVTKWLR